MSLQFKKLLIILVGHAAFCSLLALFRYFITGDDTYNFLFYNLGLAWIPLFFAIFINQKFNKFINLSLFVLWFVFFPNSGYMFTDLMHLGDIKSTVIWMDTLVLFSFALNALFIGSLSLDLIATNFLFPNLGKKRSWPIILIILYITSVGIYMGRFLRFNSWDFFLNPVQVLVQTIERYSNPALHPVALPFSIFVSLILLSNYVLVRFFIRK